MDSDGYGYTPEDHGTARLLDDMRTLSPAAIERIARGWEVRALPHLDGYHAAETAALRAIEGAHLSTEWEALQRQILDLTEGRTSLVSWKIEHARTVITPSPQRSERRSPCTRWDIWTAHMPRRSSGRWPRHFLG